MDSARISADNNTKRARTTIHLQLPNISSAVSDNIFKTPEIDPDLESVGEAGEEEDRKTPEESFINEHGEMYSLLKKLSSFPDAPLTQKVPKSSIMCPSAVSKVRERYVTNSIAEFVKISTVLSKKETFSRKNNRPNKEMKITDKVITSPQSTPTLDVGVGDANITNDLTEISTRVPAKMHSINLYEAILPTSFFSKRYKY